MSINLEVVEKHPTLTHLRLTGALDLEWTTETSTALRGMLIDGGKPVLIDLSGVDIMSSIAMGELVTCQKAMAKKGLSMVLSSPPEMVAMSLRLSGLTRLFTIVDSEDAAIAMLAPRPRPERLGAGSTFRKSETWTHLLDRCGRRPREVAPCSGGLSATAFRPWLFRGDP